MPADYCFQKMINDAAAADGDGFGGERLHRWTPSTTAAAAVAFDWMKFQSLS